MDHNDERRHANEIRQIGETQTTTPSTDQDIPQERGIPVMTFSPKLLLQRLAAARVAARDYRLALDGSAPCQPTVQYVFRWETLGEGGGPHTIAEREEWRQQAENEQTTRVALCARATADVDVAGQLELLHEAATACGWTVVPAIPSHSLETSHDQLPMRLVREAARAGVINVVLMMRFDCLTRKPHEFARLRDDLAVMGCGIVVATHTSNSHSHRGC